MRTESFSTACFRLVRGQCVAGWHIHKARATRDAPIQRGVQIGELHRARAATTFVFCDERGSGRVFETDRLFSTFAATFYTCIPFGIL